MAQFNSKNKSSRVARRWFTDIDINMKTHPITGDVVLKYDLNGKSVIEKIVRSSRPGQRIYVGSNEIPRVLDGLGISILSTSKGVVSNKTATKLGVGGEILCEVF